MKRSQVPEEGVVESAKYVKEPTQLAVFAKDEFRPRLKLAMDSNNREKMPKRVLRVTKWLSTTPAIAVCSSCSREFKAPMSALCRTRDAQVNLQEQFDRHECKHRMAR